MSCDHMVTSLLMSCDHMVTSLLMSCDHMVTSLLMSCDHMVTSLLMSCNPLADGEWVKCDDQWIGKEFFRGRYEWFDSTNFSLEAASTGTLIARVAVQFSGKCCYSLNP